MTDHDRAALALWLPVSVALAALDIRLRGKHTYSRMLSVYRDTVGETGWTVSYVGAAGVLWWHIKRFRR